MKEMRSSRRAFLGAIGAGLAGATAGCAEPKSDRSIEGSSIRDINRENLADGSAYTDVYEAIIDSVTQVRVFGVDDPRTGEEGRGQGSGFVVGDRHVVTNDHVVAGGEDADLQYINGNWTSTRLVGTDYYSDLAVLEVDHVPDVATPLSFAEKRPVVGQQVAAIGNPYGLEGSMSTGIVSGVDRTLDPPERDFSFPNVIQTDAAVNPGNSGGPLVDLGGEVIGVVNAASAENIGFAISAALSRRVVPALIDDGEYRHAYMGIGLRTVDRLVAEANDLPEAAGVIVTDVVPGEAAADAGLEGSPRTVERHTEPVPVGGDVITALDGEPIPDRHALSTFLALETSPGDTIAVDFWRDGTERSTMLTLGARPPVE
ncbi:S1C family serine protease [Halosolutus gelatinilyticus]|uniref:S1C family serine protease n=1 Tax=Halosolutus gelatinilyticus TaxID=2931975 RepID=UPI001FF0E42E|nr:trypsin-like peptidase domain-containing protein [Halosolutus gelatinilyticus]